jgi:hypothetical protein
VEHISKLDAVERNLLGLFSTDEDFDVQRYVYGTVVTSQVAQCAEEPPPGGVAIT